MKSYSAARGYFSFLEFLSWCVIVLGGIAILMGLTVAEQFGRGFGGTTSAGSYLASIIPGIGLGFAGFLGLVFCQIGRANVDSAEYGQLSLKIAREQLEISKQGLKQGGMIDQGYAAKQAARDEITSGASGPNASYGDQTTEDTTQDVNEIIEYQGKTIQKQNGQYLYANTAFRSLDAVQRYIDQIAAANAPKLGGATRS